MRVIFVLVCCLSFKNVGYVLSNCVAQTFGTEFELPADSMGPYRFQAGLDLNLEQSKGRPNPLTQPDVIIYSIMRSNDTSGLNLWPPGGGARIPWRQTIMRLGNSTCPLILSRALTFQVWNRYYAFFHSMFVIIQLVCWGLRCENPVVLRKSVTVGVSRN